MKCPKCGIKMEVRKALYAHNQEEGQPADKSKFYPVYYCCMNENCENFGKNVKILREL